MTYLSDGVDKHLNAPMEPTEQPSITEQAAKELGIAQLVPTIYQDVLQPAATEVGQRLVVVAKAVGIALAPLETAVWGYERIKGYLTAKVAAKLADKPPEEIKSPDPVIAGPVIMSMVFAAEAPHLREMYANLVARSMHSPSASAAHPSFVQVIQQLSSFEAVLLQHLAAHYSAGEPIFTDTPPRPFFSSWRELCTGLGLTDGPLADALYSNLLRLGILIERTENEVRYYPVRERYYGVDDPSVEMTTTESVMLTDYGNLFLDVCIRDI